MRTLLSADQANQTPPDTLGEYTERVLNYNVDARRKQLKRTQKSLMQPMGVTSEGAVSQRLKGITHWSLISAVNVAQSLDTSIEKLLDDSAMKMEIERQAVALRVQLDQINQMTGNKKATGDTPVASGELLRLGLNQRPSEYTVLARSRRAFCNRSRQYTSLAVPSNRRVIAHVRLAAGFPKSIGQKRAIVFLGK